MSKYWLPYYIKQMDPKGGPDIIKSKTDREYYYKTYKNELGITCLLLRNKYTKELCRIS